MNQSEKVILDRINALISMGGHLNDRDSLPEASSDVARQVYVGTLSIVSNL
jgi:hypothetical protein